MSNMKKMELSGMFFRFLGLVGVCAALSGCGHVPVTTLVKLRSFDPLTMDARVVRVAMRAPDWLEPRSGGAAITLTATQEGDARPTVKESFQLELAREPDERRAVEGFATRGARVWAFRLTPADAERMRAMQAEWRARKAQGKTGERGWKIDLGASVAGCRRGEAVPGPVISTTYLRPDVETGYLPLLKDLDLRKAASDQGADFDAETPPCGKIEDRAG
jgi:hypothetical protein